jgi:hypothetical protein
MQTTINDSDRRMIESMREGCRRGGGAVHVYKANLLRLIELLDEAGVTTPAALPAAPPTDTPDPVHTQVAAQAAANSAPASAVRPAPQTRPAQGVAVGTPAVSAETPTDPMPAEDAAPADETITAADETPVGDDKTGDDSAV